VTALSKRTDGRVQKTERSLRNALHSLIGEKPYERISVTEILDRANVGRSTFYTHFRSKDELLMNGVHEIVNSGARRTAVAQGVDGVERIVSFSRPIFEHHARHRSQGVARLTARTQARLHRRLQAMLEDIIVQNMRFGEEGRSTQTMPPRLVAQWVAATFIVVLNWWLESDCSLSATEVDSVFRAFTLPALGSRRGTP
jgi:AcrR family transcriptional regulator